MSKVFYNINNSTILHIDLVIEHPRSIWISNSPLQPNVFYCPYKCIFICKLWTSKTNKLNTGSHLIQAFLNAFLDHHLYINQNRKSNPDLNVDGEEFEGWEWHKPQEQNKIPLVPMGVLAPGSAHARPSARPPIITSRNFPANMSADLPSNISPNPSEVISEVSEP